MDLPAFLHPFARPASRDFLSIVAGQGAEVVDDQGRRYLDAMAGLWFSNVGHGHPELIAAITAQLGRLEAFHTFDIFTNPVADELADELQRIAPAPGFRVFFTSSGSEAVDTAIKLSRAAHALAGEPDRRVVISRRPSYHGVTYGGMAATGLPANQASFGTMLPDVVQVPHDDLTAVEGIMTSHPGTVAAVIAEPVIGAGGVHPASPGYLEGLRRLCDTHGAWLILDDVICGFGRLGTWWGAEFYGVRPDLVTFAKGVTSGYLPLGGVLVGAAVRAPIEADTDHVLRHGHTYSGHPVACAAALANLRVLREEGLLERSDVLGARLRAGLDELATAGQVADVRGAGAVHAVGMPAGHRAVEVRDEMLTRGVIPRAIGEDTVSFCPPLVVDEAQVDRCVEVLAEALEVVGSHRRPAGVAEPAE
jgi:putrescine---pyruvate transaminase